MERGWKWNGGKMDDYDDGIRFHINIIKIKNILNKSFDKYFVAKINSFLRARMSDFLHFIASRYNHRHHAINASQNLSARENCANYLIFSSMYFFPRVIPLHSTLAKINMRHPIVPNKYSLPRRFSCHANFIFAIFRHLKLVNCRHCLTSFIYKIFLRGDRERFDVQCFLIDLWTIDLIIFRKSQTHRVTKSNGYVQNWSPISTCRTSGRLSISCSCNS